MVMAFFGKKKKKKKNEKAEPQRKESNAGKKKKNGKARRKPSVVSTKARGPANPRNPGSTLRRRTTSRGARRQFRPHFIVDPTTKKLVQVNLPTHVTGGVRRYNVEQAEEAERENEVGNLRRRSDKVDLGKAVLRHPGKKKDNAAGNPQGHPPPPPAPPPPLPTSSKVKGHKGVTRKKSWAEDPADLGPEGLLDDSIPRQNTYRRSGLRRTSNAKKQVIRSPRPRSRTSEDLKEWLNWRMNVNEQLTSFVMRDRAEFAGALPVGAFPRTLKDERLNAIFQHAQTQETPKTSLDNLSYMIYGIPRVKLPTSKQQSNDIPDGQRTPSPDYEEQDTGVTSDRSCHSRDTGDTYERYNTHELTASTVVSESDHQVSPPNPRHHDDGPRRALFRRNGRRSPTYSPARRVASPNNHLSRNRALVRRTMHSPAMQRNRHHRTPSPIYQNSQVALGMSNVWRPRYDNPRRPNRSPPPLNKAARGLRSPTKDSPTSPCSARPGTPGCHPQFRKPPIPGAVPTVLSLCSLQHVTSQRELRHVPPPGQHSGHVRTDNTLIGSPRRRLRNAEERAVNARQKPHKEGAGGHIAPAQEAYRHYRQQVPKKY